MRGVNLRAVSGAAGTCNSVSVGAGEQEILVCPRDWALGRSVVSADGHTAAEDVKSTEPSVAVALKHCVTYLAHPVHLCKIRQCLLTARMAVVSSSR